ncbi:MAG: phosphatidylserine/phosphatidylglycerophosphate/cardiolipinsynthase-like protein [Frankiales bacterium]|nr:phosphatidylserine/phosphatidylglycerophosphate/cardiolipinsynthase-like protein [Frankiales bacterium]
MDSEPEPPASAHAEWFLTAVERGNPWTRLDRGNPAGAAWTDGNDVTPLIHGASYLPELLRCIESMRQGDLLLFTDWRGDPDQLMDGPGTEVGRVLCQAAGRGVLVKGLVWRSHLDRFAFSEQQNRHLGEEINRAGGEVVRDMRVRAGGSHHQKFVVLRHRGRPELDVAFVGGIDLCHSRSDDEAHDGDVQRQPMAKVYGERPPWHDIQVAVRGPAVNDVESVFRERWEDPTRLNRNVLSNLADRLRGEDVAPSPLPAQLPAPAHRGVQHVQLLRTYPTKRTPFPFAPYGERSVAHAYEKVVGLASSLIYIEDQYFWNTDIVASFARALEAKPELRLIVVLPLYPDQDGRFSEPPNLVGRQQALDLVREAGGERVGIYGIENAAGVPVYVHAKVGVVDDVWASVGSDNINRRSWTHDSELACAVIDDRRDGRRPAAIDQLGSGARVFARDLRLRLAAEHLDRASGDVDDLCDPVTAFEAFARTADAVQRWHDTGKRGTRPVGRLRPYRTPRLSKSTLWWATPLYRTIYDPDGRGRRAGARHGVADGGAAGG